jgi:hypothetical protein
MVAMSEKARLEAGEQLRALKYATVHRSRITVMEDLYPRNDYNNAAISSYAEQMRAGAVFPPLKVDQKYRLIDGLHRLTAYDQNGIIQIPIEREPVKDDADFFKRAMTANSHHGQRYTGIDYANMVLKGRKLGIEDDEIAHLVHITPGYLADVTRDWFALNSKTEQVALKRTIRHMHGRTLTADQLAANKKISGMQPTFYVNQLVLLMDNDLIDLENTKTMEGLQRLQESLANFYLKVAKHQHVRNNGGGR